jgi:hypothetical protein
MERFPFVPEPFREQEIKLGNQPESKQEIEIE